MKKIIKDNILGFIIAAFIFGGVGTVVATTILSSSVSYTNNDQTTVESAIDELYGKVNIACYNGTCGKLAFRYWNDGFSDTIYQVNGMPTDNYVTRELLEQNYGTSNFANSPVYIRSILIDGNVVGHEACLWYGDKEFCIAPGYWVGTINVNSSTAAAQTVIKLRRDMQNALVVETNLTCPSDVNYTDCYVGNFSCHSNVNGNVDCHAHVSNDFCYVNYDGSAYCKNNN